MARGFEIDFIGRSNISSNFSRCDTCRRLTLLNTYTTRRFVLLFNLPLIPLGKCRMLDECPYCGQRGKTSLRKHDKERKQNLALMMDGFADDADNPDTCSHALRTLMIYNQTSWFEDVQKSYGLRFEKHMQIQYIIAQGLCRFGDYEQAILYCSKAIVLGADKQAHELLAFCQTLRDASPGKDDLEKMRFIEESTLKSYIPLASAASVIVLVLLTVGIASFRTHRAWLVNGSLRSYSFTLDNKTYQLDPGNRQQIKLKLGSHELKVETMPPREFTYSTPLIKQVLKKHLLVINPDAMALLSVESESGSSENLLYSHGKQIHILSGVSYPLFGFQKKENTEEKSERVSLYRPDTHMAMVVRLKELEAEKSATIYARRVLSINPAAPEAARLLDVVLKDVDFAAALKFMEPKLAITPALLPWHRYYQDLVLRNQPEEHTLVREYTERCTNDPDQPEYFYLLAHVLPNRADAHKFFQHSEKGRGMFGHGYHAIARELFIHAEFKKALPFSTQAIERSAANPVFLNLHEQVLLALRKYDALLAQNQELAPDDTDRTRAQKRVLYLTRAGYHREAEAEAILFSERTGTSLAKLNAIRFYAVGNINGYLSCLSESKDPTAEFQKQIHQNHFSDAEKTLENDEHHAWREHLILYCSAMEQGKVVLAKHHMTKAISEIGKDTIQRTLISTLLTAPEMPALETIKELDIEAQQKALLCVTLGFRFPSNRESINALSREYNFNPTYPQLLIKKWNHGKPIQRIKPDA